MYDIFGKYGGIRQIRMYVDVHVLFAVGILLKGLHVCHAYDRYGLIQLKVFYARPSKITKELL